MTIASHVVRLGINEKTPGVFFVGACPKCDTERDFYLIESEGNLSFFGFAFGRPATMLDLRCGACAYEIRVDPKERELLEQLKANTDLLKAGRLTHDLYVAALKKIPARFVRDVQALTESWKCSKCGETNPMSFELCWNCSSKGSQPSASLESRELNIPGVKPPETPWG